MTDEDDRVIRLTQPGAPAPRDPLADDRYVNDVLLSNVGSISYTLLDDRGEPVQGYPVTTAVQAPHPPGNTIERIARLNTQTGQTEIVDTVRSSNGTVLGIINYDEASIPNVGAVAQGQMIRDSVRIEGASVASLYLRGPGARDVAQTGGILSTVGAASEYVQFDTGERVTVNIAQILRDSLGINGR